MEGPIRCPWRTFGEETSWGGSLIVLPEASNLEGNYRDRIAPSIRVECALTRLAKLSSRYGVVFVVGLPESKSRSEYLNSAYLVDGDPAHLLCHKNISDNCGNYVSCSEDPVSAGNPIEHKRLHGPGVDLCRLKSVERNGKSTARRRKAWSPLCAGLDEP
jgi:hypothetical protein